MGKKEKNRERIDLYIILKNSKNFRSLEAHHRKLSQEKGSRGNF